MAPDMDSTRTTTCPYCGRTLRTDERYCPGCGAELIPPGQGDEPPAAPDSPSE